MPNASVRLISSPGMDYESALLSALSGATEVTWVTAFATSSGIEKFVKPFASMLENPTSQARIVVAVDRQGFNAEPAFRALMALKQQAGARLSVSIVPEASGLLHAKALLAQGPLGSRLIVGSANLTSSAFRRNYELGIEISDPPHEVVNSFRRFVAALNARSLDQKDADEFLGANGLLSRPAALSPARAGSAAAPSSDWQHLLQRIGDLAPLSALPIDAGDTVREWIAAGFLVGKGARLGDALVLRIPLDALERRGLVAATKKRSLGGSARESRTLGYQIELLPPDEAELVQRGSRRVSRLLSRLALNLPCFGLWMPASYWDVFVLARTELLKQPGLDPARILSAAKAQRAELLERGALERDVSRIVDTMITQESISAPDRDKVFEFLTDEMRRRCLARTPELIADAVQFRTARQVWAPFESTNEPLRQLMVDLIYSVFAPTLRTGEWPARFHSFAAKDLASALEGKLRLSGHDPDGLAASKLLECSRTWEHVDRPIQDVVDEFRRLIPLDHEFSPPDLDELAKLTEIEGDSDDVE